MYEITLVHENGNTFETIESGGTFLLPCTYTVSSFTDATGAPGIIKCIEPTGLSLTASPETICAGESATLTASATGAVSYSLDGTNWQPETDFNETPLSTTAYTLYAQTEAGCSVSVANAVAVAVGQPGADGEPSTCGCATGTTECGGICKDTGTYTTNDGDCAGCHIAYVQQRDQCDAVINAKYSTYSSTCTTPNQVTNDGACTINCHYAFQRLKDACGNVIQAQHGTYYTASTCASSTCEPQWGCNPTCWDNMISVWEGVYDGQCKDVCIKASLGWTCTSGGHNSLNDSCYCYRCN
jgi:hypothetical protein